jgi:hypothetical protein
MADRKVPLGVSVITILMFIGAIIDIAAGVFMLIEKSPVAEAADVSESTIVGYAIAAIVSGVIIGLLAFGLRSGSNGVRLVIAVVMALRIALSVWVIIAVPGARFEGIVGAIVALVVLYLLYGNEDSKAFFEGRPSMT